MQDKPINENQLLSDLLHGKPRAVQSWYACYAPSMLRYAEQKLSSPETAQELVQETFLNALKNLRLFRQKSSLLTWMIGILNHEIADYYRKQYAKRAIKVIPLADWLLHEPVVDAPETPVKVRMALDQMVHEQKELLLQKYIDGKRVKQIARDLGRSVKAIESELFRARVEFRRIYATLEVE
jgi:RNA polymerase sigma-70 factor, ECF subfamily